MQFGAEGKQILFSLADEHSVAVLAIMAEGKALSRKVLDTRTKGPLTNRTKWIQIFHPRNSTVTPTVESHQKKHDEQARKSIVQTNT